MIKNQQSILSNGEALNQRQEHHTLVILAMNGFLARRFDLSPNIFLHPSTFVYSAE